MSERSARALETEPRARNHRARPSLPAAAPSPPTVLLDLQRSAGNRAVTGLVQRTAVTAPTTQETLFNDRSVGGTAGARVYGGTSGAKFDMARGGSPEVVTVTVRIRFVDRGRNLSAPDAQGKVHAVDAAQSTAAVIPPGDARRPFAENICATSPPHWNNRAVLVGRREAPGRIASLWNDDKGGPVRLPLRFRAVPVYDLAAPADLQISVFPLAVQAGGQQHPIDAGHYYMNKGPNYSANDEAIYAHEYGHLLGLNDEYSQSNPQMHAVLHQMDPATAGARGQAMDREAVRRMVMAALTRPLMDRISASTAEIAGVLSAGRRPIAAALGTALQGALADPQVAGNFATVLPPSAATLAPQIPGLVSAAVRDRRNTTGLAGQVVPAEFATAPLGAMIRRLYYGALHQATTGAVDLGGVSTTIRVEGGAGIDAAGNAVAPASGLWAGGATPAASLAAVVDGSAGAARAGRVPPVRASGSVLRELAALPAGWAGIPAAAPSALSAATLATDLKGALLAAWMAKAAAALSGTPGPAALTRRRALAAAIQSTVHNAAQAAAVNAVRAFLKSEVEPVLQSSVTTLMAGIGAEVTRVMGTPAEQLAAAAPKDPAITALVGTMKTTLAAQSAAATVTQIAAGRPAVSPGVTAPAQQVTYSTVNMMSDNTDIFRPDQFTHLATLFNATSSLRRDREGEFHIEMGAT